MSRNEADTRAQLIDPVLHRKGWTEDLIRREETEGEAQIIAGRARKRGGRADYVLRVRVVADTQHVAADTQPVGGDADTQRVAPGTQAVAVAPDTQRMRAAADTQPVAVALIEAKAERYSPARGLEQAKAYAAAGKRLHVPFVYASNGHKVVEFNALTGETQGPFPMESFPGPEELRARWEAAKGFSLDSAAARPLLQTYRSESDRRYYQDAAVRAALEKIAAGKTPGERRALLAMATGSGKTRVATHLLKKIADAGQLRRALFVCDRDELRTQALAAFQDVFGSDAAAASTNNPEKNARVVVATYQTLGVAAEEDDASFLTAHYPEGYFSHIVIDEAHRSGWGKWSQVLARNPNAVQIGLTATPREFEYVKEDSDEARYEDEITNDNIRYFGEPAYEYSIGQGIDDGYLAAMEIRKRDVFLENYAEREGVTGVHQDDLEGKFLSDARTGAPRSLEEARAHYQASGFEASLVMPDRVGAMCGDLFGQLLETGGPEQKTIIFCARDDHADAVAIEMNNLYAAHCAQSGARPSPDYAFKCTAAGGKDHLSDLRAAATHHFVAATVDLLTTGVDVPRVANIVFFKYVKSPIAFHQMVGRGTRLDPASGKLMFRVYDYTNATRLFSEDLKRKMAPQPTERREGAGRRPESIQVEGIDVQISPAGTFVLARGDDGAERPMPLEEYRQRLAAKLLEDAPALDEFRQVWIDPEGRATMLRRLPDDGRAPYLVRQLTLGDEYDIYDVLADAAYGVLPRNRVDRAGAFVYKNDEWLREMPERTAAAVKAIASQFAKGGTPELESPKIFSVDEVRDAGGLDALQPRPREIVRETKERMFSA